MADNFAMAVNYGRKGSSGTGYPSPEIIDAIYRFLEQ